MIPRAQSEVRNGTGAYHIGATAQVDIGDFEEWCLAGLFAQGRRNAVVDSNGTIKLLRDPALAEEAYRICVKPKDILIHASTETGVIRAFATLLQLEADGNISCVEISDSPRLSYRGLLLDCSRHFIPVDTIKKIIDCMMLLKMNTLHLHLSDDHGWRIKLDAFPALCREHDQFYTKEQLQNLVKYAHDRAVEIIPEIDVPGHASAFLSRYPEYSCTGEPVEAATEGGVYDHILCTGKDEVFAAIEKILKEVAALFPSRYFHIGGDEVPKEQWERCPCCKQRMVDEQIETLEGLQGYFTKRVSSILAACGKTAIAWNDTLLADGKSAAGIIQYWSPDVSDAAMLRYIEQGGKFIFSNCYKCYLNFDSSLLPLKKVYETVQQIGEKPCSDYSGYVGAECALWTENISSEEDLERALFPRILAFAENCWLGSGEYKDFTARAEVLCTCLRERGVTATEREMWDPEDERRLAGVKKYMNTLLISRQKREGIASAVKTVNRSQIKNFASEFLKPSDIPAIMKMLGGENPDHPKAETSDVKELCAYEKKHLDFMRKIAPECMVLLKSQKPFLIERGESVALYGGGARKTQKGGTGSGDVNSVTFISIEEALERNGISIASKVWLDEYDKFYGIWEQENIARVQEELKQRKLEALVHADAGILEGEHSIPLQKCAEKAIFVLSRIAGEGRDRERKGNFRLTESEVRDIRKLSEMYEHFILVLNVGGVVDLTPVVDVVPNILLMSQLGAVSSEALLDVLMGRSYPSGKLTATWAAESDYLGLDTFGDPDDTVYREDIFVGYKNFEQRGIRPIWPFGFGLMNSDFSFEATDFTFSEGDFSVGVHIKNIGSRNAKDILQLYAAKPVGKLDQPPKCLVAYKKTPELRPGEEVTLVLSGKAYDLASYDETRRQWILERGTYRFYLGEDCENVVLCGESFLGAETKADMRMPKNDPYEKHRAKAQHIAEQLSNESLTSVCLGRYSEGQILNTIGQASVTVAGAAGETTDRCKEYGLPSIVMADGPAGLRLDTQYGKDENGVYAVSNAQMQRYAKYVPENIRLLIQAKRGRPPCIS